MGTLTPALAVGFGVIPLASKDDYVIVGHMPEICPDCFKFLETYYGKEIVPVRLDEKVAAAAINEAYLKGHGLNHDTFPDPDFLLKPENESKLLNEKKDDIGIVTQALKADEIIFLDTSYRSERVSLDQPEEQGELDLESDEIPFKIRHGIPVVHQKEIPKGTFLVERRNYCYLGSENRQGISRTDVNSLPYVIHPSEIQVTQVHPDGSLAFYIYDHLEHVPAGGRARFRVPYFFISFGHRYGRVLSFEIHGVYKFRRKDIRYVEESLPWDLGDVERWLSSFSG